MNYSELVIFIIISPLIAVRGWLTHNYIKSKQGLKETALLDYAEEILNFRQASINTYFIVIPFYSATKNEFTRKKQHTINTITYIIYGLILTYVFLLISK
jgi:hypothetical protein